MKSAALSWRDRDGALSAELVALLPEPLRQHEGQRHLDLAALATRPAQRIAYAAFLPWEQMRASSSPCCVIPTPKSAEAAISSFVAAARFDGRRLAEVLELLTARRNEQDPVRLLMLTAGGVPPGRWKPEHLPELGTVLRHALDAADLHMPRGRGGADNRWNNSVPP